MDSELILLRLTHFFAGTYWFGVGIFSVIFFTPTIRQTGPEGQTVMRHLVGKTKFSSSMSGAALLTTVSGIVLYWIDSSHLNYEWITTSGGVILSIGAASGIIAYVISVFIQSRSAKKISMIHQSIVNSGQPPLPEQLTLIQIYQKRLILGANVTAAILVVTLVSMSIWRYIF